MFPDDGLTKDEIAESIKDQVEKDPVFSCCFCGEVLLEEETSGISLYNAETGEPRQFWFCHEQCFRVRLMPLYNESPPDG